MTDPQTIKTEMLKIILSDNELLDMVKDIQTLKSDPDASIMVFNKRQHMCKRSFVNVGRDMVKGDSGYMRRLLTNMAISRLFNRLKDKYGEDPELKSYTENYFPEILYELGR